VQYDVNDLFNVTEDDVTCSICLEIVTKPRRLPCQHSFCESCLGEWYRCNADFVANKYLHCPLCRERHAMPKQSGVRQFSLDHRMEAMADYVRNIPQMPTGTAGVKLC
jgi:tripartite motif-containing protein 2/3